MQTGPASRRKREELQAAEETRAARRRSKREALKNRNKRPAALPVQVGTIPRSMRRMLRWLLWRWEWSEEQGRWTKVPHRANGKFASPTDARTWCDFKTAMSAYRQSRQKLPGERFSGIGFVLGDGWAGVDLDGVRDPEAGALHPAAAAIIARLASYTEISPSGTGVKVFVRGSLPAGRRRREGSFGPGTGIETYDGSRYFAVTGIHLAGTPGTVEERTELTAVWREHVATGDGEREIGRDRSIDAGRARRGAG